MTNLSDYFLASTIDDFYKPAMMEYNGSTSYYSLTSLTTTGNKLTFLLTFAVDSFTGTSALQYLVALHGGTVSKRRMQIYASASDYSVANWQDRLQMVVKNSSSAVVCRLISPVGFLDGNKHTMLVSYDGDTGTAQFIIDGDDVDDTGNGSRIAPVTATLETGAAGELLLGATHGPGSYLDGQIGFCGHHEANLINWYDFMESNGNPIEQDQVVWANSGFGSQPLFFNEHGSMVNNLGSAGNMTVNGTILIGKGGN